MSVVMAIWFLFEDFHLCHAAIPRLAFVGAARVEGYTVVALQGGI